MSLILYAILFLFSCFALSYLSSRFIKNLVEVAKYLRWREFIVAFFVMGLGTSLTNLFVDLNAAFHGLQQISFGDIMGGNLVDLTLSMAIAVFFSRKFISTESKMVRGSALFTTIVAVLPWLLIIRTGGLDRLDGIILILAFFLYCWWLFSKDDRFKKIYHKKEVKSIHKSSSFVWALCKMIVILAMLLLASEAVVSSAQYFSSQLHISLALVGVLIVALGNCFPEAYFSIISARKEQGWMVLGDLMGSVIVCATLVLGIVALVAPFQIKNFSPFLLARVFMLIACIFYVFFVNTGRKITKKEGLFLLFIYIAFLLSEILFKF